MKKIAFCAVAALLLGVWNADAQIISGSSYSSSTEYTSKVKNTRYQGELNFGYGLGGKIKDSDGDKDDAKFSRVFIETVHGMRINEYAFAGLGVGFQYAYDDKNLVSAEEDSGVGFIPLFVDLKGYYPVTDDFAPYVSVDLGYGLPVIGSDGRYDTLKGGFYASYGIGLNYKKLNFGLGWQHQSFKYEYDGETGEGYAVNSFYVKVGFKF